MSRQQDGLEGFGEGRLRAQVERTGEREVPTVSVFREGFEGR